MPSNANDVTVYHGNHAEIICNADGTTDITLILLVTANSMFTTSSEHVDVNMIIEMGIIKSNVTYDASPEIKNLACEVINGGKAINVSFDYYPDTNEFFKIDIRYKTTGLFSRSGDGTFHFNHTFHSKYSALDMLIKLPKPSEFSKISLTETCPVPAVYFEDTSYYMLGWNTAPYIDCDDYYMPINFSYRLETDWSYAHLWLWLSILSAVVALSVERIIWIIQHRKEAILFLKSKINRREGYKGAKPKK